MSDCPICNATHSERGRHADQGYCEACNAEPHHTAHAAEANRRIAELEDNLHRLSIINAEDIHPSWHEKSKEELIEALRFQSAVSKQLFQVEKRIAERDELIRELSSALCAAGYKFLDDCAEFHRFDDDIEDWVRDVAKPLDERVAALQKEQA